MTAAAAGPVTLAGVIRSEWIKLRSVRSTPVVLTLTVVLMAGLPLMLAARPSYNPVDQNLFGVHFATLTVGILGVLVITGEYATGMIQATFCAVPRRLPVLWAKAAVFAIVVFAVTLGAGLLAFLAGQARYGGASPTAPGSLRVIAGAALFLAAMGLLGLGFGFWTRSTAGGIALVIVFTFVFSQGGDLLPASWQPHVIPYLPFQAGEAVYTVQPYPAYAHELLGPWAGLGVVCGYAAAALIAAAVRLRRTDATTSFGWRERVRGLARPGPDAPASGHTRAPAGAPVAAGRAAARPATARPVTARPATARPVTQAAVIGSEWIKFRSVRSIVVVSAVTVVLIVASGLIVTADTVWNTMTAAQRAGFDPIGQSLLGVRNFADLPVSMLGVLVIGAEYTTGMIRASFCAVPRRLPVLWAKAAVLAPAVFALTLIAALGAFLGGQALLGRHGVSLAAPGALRAVFGAALFLTLAGLLGMGLGFLTRSTGGAIAAVAGIDVGLQILGIVLPASWQHLVPYLPGNAGQAIFATAPYPGNTLRPLTGFAVYLGYTAVVIAAAAITLRRRDV